MNPLNSIFTEKYRPKLVGDVVGGFKDKVMKYLAEPSSIPHFLLYSKHPGTGKSSLARAIINELGCDSLILNSSDDRKIETIREKVKEFALTKSSKDGLRRVIFLDEADGMLRASQDALRNIMEIYANNVIFILAANNINKIIDPIKSRCVLIPFAYPEKQEVFKYLEMICEKENMDYTELGLKALIDINYPSIRNSVITLQDLKTEGKPVLVENVKPPEELFERMWKLIKDKRWMEIKREIMQSTIDPRELNTYFWMKALKEEDVNLKLVQICCRNEKDIAWGADAKIIMITSLIELCK